MLKILTMIALLVSTSATASADTENTAWKPIYSDLTTALFCSRLFYAEENTHGYSGGIPAIRNVTNHVSEILSTGEIIDSEYFSAVIISATNYEFKNMDSPKFRSDAFIDACNRYLVDIPKSYGWYDHTVSLLAKVVNN